MRFCFIIVALLVLACQTGKQYTTDVVLHITNAHKKIIYLNRIGITGEKTIVVDSLVAHGGEDSLVFHIDDTEQRLFEFTAAEVDMHILFTNDARRIDVYARYDRPDLFSFKGSPGSSSLHDFLLAQDTLAAKARLIATRLDSLGKQHATDSRLKPLRDSLDAFMAAAQQRYRRFADTTTSAGAFLVVYNNIEYGKDVAGFKAFLVRAVARFPQSRFIRQLRDDAVEYAKIFEKEFRPGDVLPAITLPASDGYPFSTASLKGKYYLVDFWSTWCDPCMAYMPVKQRLHAMYPPARFEVVSVAIDNRIAAWHQAVSQPGNSWRQLIDTGMWQGRAVRTLVFDSIPFNFLVSPAGVVLRSGIPADSLVQVVSKYIQPQDRQ